MNNLSPTIVQALEKSDISEELAAEFKNFLSQHPMWEMQAIYLLDEKRKKISEIVEDLYGVSIQQQTTWQKEKTQDEIEQKIEELVNKQSSNSSKKRKSFKNWKQEHGLDIVPFESQNIHNIIRIEPFTDAEFQQKFRWQFNQSKYRKKGWGKEKPIQNIQTFLLENNHSPGGRAKFYLENNHSPGESAKFYLENNPEIRDRNSAKEDNLPNPLILDGEETHYLIHLLFGHHLLFFHSQTETLKQNTSLVNWELKYISLENHRIIYINFHLESKSSDFKFEKYRDQTFILGGTRKGILVKNNYWKFKDVCLSANMIREAIRGVLVPETEWNDFFNTWKKIHPHIALKPTKEEDFQPTFSIQKLKGWQFWLQWNQKRTTPIFKKDKKIPKFYFSTKIKKYTTTQTYLEIVDFDPEEHYLENEDDCLQTVRLFKYLKHILKLKKKDNYFILDSIIASQFLTLARDYPYLYNHLKKPLINKNISLRFAITIKKDPLSPSQYLLKGNFYRKKELAGSKKWIPFLKKEEAKQIVGLIPSYLLYKDQIFNIENIVSGRWVEDDFNSVSVNEKEISDFYARTYPVLKARNIKFFDPQKLLEVSAIFHYSLQGVMTVKEEKGVLIGKFKVIMKTEIGDFKYPSDIKGKEFQQFFKGKMLSIPRNKKLEYKLWEKIVNDGWIKKKEGLYTMDENKTLQFVLYTLSQKNKNDLIVYYGAKNLKRWKVDDIIPKTSIDIKNNSKWFELNFSFEKYNLDMKKIISIWQAGKNYIDLGKEKGLVRIDKKWMNHYVPILNRLFSSSNKDTDKKDISKIIVSKENFSLIEELKDFITNKKKLQIKSLKIIPEKIPTTVQATLRNYQKEGVNWLCFLRRNHFSGILADDMGLGKTLQTLTYFEILRGNKKTNSQKPHLIICPTSVMNNWEEEIKKFTPTLSFILYHGKKRKKDKTYLKKADLIITTYTLLQKEISFFKKIKYDVIVLDEAQNIKNANSKTAKGIYTLESLQRLSLTGTPIENNVTELWSQFHFLLPNLLGNYKNFQKIYVKPSKNASREYDFSLLRKQTKAFILRRIKQNVAHSLPPKTEQFLYCEMGEAQRKLYSTVLVAQKNILLDKIESNTKKNQIKICFFDALLRLRQICCDPRLSTLSGETPPPSAKLELFLDRIEEIVAEGHRVLVFSQFVKMLKLIQTSLNEKNIPFLQLDGSTKKRHQIIKKFQNEDSYPLFLISLKAGGVGLNLTAADYVIHFDPWWNPAVENQASDRAYRIGQNKHVFVYKLITKNSIEEKIVALQNKKTSLTENIISNFDNFNDMIHPNHIEELFTLS